MASSLDHPSIGGIFLYLRGCDNADVTHGRIDLHRQGLDWMFRFGLATDRKLFD